jgi:signal transduction histidine kinase
MQPVLLVMVAAQLGHVRPPAAIGWIVVQTIGLGLVVARQPSPHAVWGALGYFAFQIFGFLTARIAHDEREAKQALAEANAELRVATGLLDMSSRAEERLRIARDLHDLIGHHLTALSLNLEVASHLAEGPAKEQVEKAKSLTRLLLSDVRDVVSRLRADEQVDLGAALTSLREAVPSPNIHVDTDGVAVAEPLVAETALRAVQEIVTNAVRHSGARNLWLTVATQDHTLTVDARDDGAGTDRVVFGNGLRGMRERVQQAGGTLEVASMRGRGFEVHVRIPIGGAA